MTIHQRLQQLAGINLTEAAFSSEKNYADRSEAELHAIKKELKAIQAITSKMSFKWHEAQKEIEKVDLALAALKEPAVTESVEEVVTEASIAYDVFLNGKKIDTVFDTEKDAAEVKRSLINHDGYDSGITVKKAKKLKESKFDSVELRLPASWASALINGDSSGLSDEEEAELDNWVEWASAEYNINAGQPVDVSDEPEFASRHDASPDVLATDVLTYTYFVNESVNDTLEEAKEGSLWVLKVAEPGSDSFGIQFSGTRSECADEWRDVKKDWPKGSKHKIERHVEESVDSEEDTLTEETSTTRKEVLKNHIAYHKENMGRLEKNSTSYKDHKKALEKYEAELKGLEESVEEPFDIEAIAARIIQEVDGTKTPEVDYQNGPTENSGIKHEQGTKIKVPAAVKSAVTARIRELNAAIAKYDEKGYNDKSIKAQAVECLEQLMKDLSSNDLEGVKKAQIYLGTLMSPLTDFFPPQIINWLANAYNPLVKESEYKSPEEREKEVYADQTEARRKWHAAYADELKKFDPRVDKIIRHEFPNDSNLVLIAKIAYLEYFNDFIKYIDDVPFAGVKLNADEHKAAQYGLECAIEDDQEISREQDRVNSGYRSQEEIDDPMNDPEW